MENRYRHTVFMVKTTDNKRPPQWLALHFQHLAMDQYAHNHGQQEQDVPHAISEKSVGRQCVIDHNQVAGLAGIHIGMPVTVAHGLIDSLQISVRNRQAEQAGLERLAAWCYQYSSQVCIARQRNSLLLEIAASRCLFGDAEAIARRIQAELEQLGYRTAKGIAPTPEAAHLAARHGLCIHTSREIRKSIAALGIDSLRLHPASIRALQKMGFRTVAEILRLPRKALTRRLGVATADYLDRLLGHRPDPLKTFHPPENFSAGMDLPDTEHTQGLIFPLKRLVQELCGVLRARDRGIQALQVHLQLGETTQTISVHLQRTTRSEAHLVLLLRERLERLQLPCPVRHIRLQAAHFLPCAADQSSLLKETGMSPVHADADNNVIERLQARLGPEAVKGIRGLQDHRPEHSWSLRELDEPVSYAARPARPTWLLPEPERCSIDNYRILAGPERIESGWWDGRDCRRDYFVVRDSGGSTLWAFREYKPRHGWYLHGLFA
jgi:protein ImuB